MPFREHFEVAPAGIVRGRADRPRQVEFEVGPLAGELAQPPQGQLDIARAKFQRIVEVAEFALLPDFYCRTIALLFRPDPNPFWVVARVAERRSTPGADPLAAALM